MVGATAPSLYSPASGTLGISTAGVERARITAAGDVGIGTSSPQGSLDVTATGATVNQFLTGGAGNNLVTGIFRIGSGSGRGASIQGFRGASSNIHSLDFYTYNAADVFGMRLDASGNLGIGTSSPASKLEVSRSEATAYDATNMLATGEWQRISNPDTTANNSTFLLFNPNSSWSGISGISTGTNSGALAFGTRNAGGNLTERARITSGGNLLVGTTTNNASGGVIQVSNGITFPATQSASSDANTLDDYEEGTWTPSVGGTATYTAQQATYTKIGRVVQITAYLIINSIGTGSSTTISGLPFATATTSNFVNSARALTSATNIVSINCIAAGTTVTLYSRTAASASDSTNAIMQNSTLVEFNGFYFV